MKTSCALCDTPVRSHVYLDGERPFCCSGCQAVYQILSAQQALDNFHEHPLFAQAVKAGIISNPEILEKQRSRSTEESREEYQKLHLEIQDLWCPSCAEVIRLVLRQEKGVKQCVVDYCTDLGVIEFTPRHISKERILSIITNLGYRPASIHDPRQNAVSKSLYLRFIVAAFFSLNLMMFAYPLYIGYFENEDSSYFPLMAWLSLFGSIPVLTYSAWPIWRRLIAGLSVGIWGMELLVAIGVAAATGLSLYELLEGRTTVYFDSMTVIIVFMLLGKIIESKAKWSAKDSLIQLTRALPRRGRKVHADGTAAFVPLKEIHPGDSILVLTGERIVLDGVVIEGEGACDESVMTGESWPVTKRKDATVLSGSILQHGQLTLRVTSKSEDTTLHRIIDMVSQEMDHKSMYARAGDSIVRWFIPLVILLAIASALLCILFQIMDPGLTIYQTAVIRAVSVLLISCPCAIGIAAPLAESYLLNALARMGALVRNRGCLAYLGKETRMIFDKTGTVTEGQFTVLNGMQSVSEIDKACLKGLCTQSNHPISVAIGRSLTLKGMKMDNVEEIVGRGMRGLYDGNCYILGSQEFLKQLNINIPTQQNKETTVWFAKNGCYITQLELGDQIRPEASEVVSALQSLKPLLVSGDSAPAVEAVAATCGFASWHASCNPLEKKTLVEALRKQGHIIGMIGDGINDAPALTSSHVGMAVVTASDISIQVSDILLTTDRLHVIPKMRELAQKGHRIIKQNLFWAFFYNVIGIGLAMAGVLTPLFAAFAMVISSFIVLLNAQRIR